jgi:hypothetical protein
MDPAGLNRVVDPSLLPSRRWVAMCAAAEGVGMTAAAAAATVSHSLVGEPGTGGEAVVALSLVVAGGLVEGVALGGLQARGLARMLPALSRRRWLLVTTAVAGLGWAAATAPGVLAGPDDGAAAPPLLLVLLGAGALGAVMGAVLGAAQATVLRGLVRHPWRWVGANAVAWTPTMVVIFLGATTPDAGWSGPAVVGLGALTGLGAGAVLGLTSGWFLPALDGAPVRNRLVAGLLSSPAHRALDRSLTVLRVRGSVTGRWVELPVQYALGGPGLVVVPGRPERKRWWRNLARPAPVEVLLGGEWRRGEGRVLAAGDDGHHAALADYRRRWPRVRLPDDALLVAIEMDGPKVHRRAGTTSPGAGHSSRSAAGSVPRTPVV